MVNQLNLCYLPLLESHTCDHEVVHEDFEILGNESNRYLLELKKVYSLTNKPLLKKNLCSQKLSQLSNIFTLNTLKIPTISSNRASHNGFFVFFFYRCGFLFDNCGCHQNFIVTYSITLRLIHCIYAKSFLCAVLHCLQTSFSRERELTYVSMFR